MRMLLCELTSSARTSRKAMACILPAIRAGVEGKLSRAFLLLLVRRGGALTRTIREVVEAAVGRAVRPVMGEADLLVTATGSVVPATAAAVVIGLLDTEPADDTEFRDHHPTEFAQIEVEAISIDGLRTHDQYLLRTRNTTYEGHDLESIIRGQQKSEDCDKKN